MRISSTKPCSNPIAIRRASLAVLGLLVLSCTSRDDRWNPLGAECDPDEDECRPPLICSHHLCLSPCETRLDCPGGSECIATEGDPSIRVCTAPPLEECPETPCPTGLECGPDGICREACDETGGCHAGYYCFDDVCLELGTGPCPGGPVAWFADRDGDLFGDGASSVSACSPPDGYVADATDCDDADPTVHPGAVEVCDVQDNDCDGLHNEELTACPTVSYGGEDLVVTGASPPMEGCLVEIGRFVVPVGVTLVVRPFDGLEGGWLEVSAEEIEVAGTIDASGGGYGGGGGGGGGAGNAGGGGDCPNPPDPYASGGAAGAGGPGAFPGGAGQNICEREARGGNGGNGGGPAGGGGTGTGGYQHRSGGDSSGNSVAGVTGGAGLDGGYVVVSTNGDTSTDAVIHIGSGGGGGGGGSGGCAGGYDTADGGGGGGAGAAGGGRVALRARTSLVVSGVVTTDGSASAGDGGSSEYTCSSARDDWGGNGGSGASALVPGSRAGGPSRCWDCDCYWGGHGGAGGRGAGGGILLRCDQPGGVAISGAVSSLGGEGRVENGGTVKVFVPGPAPDLSTVSAGRVCEADLAGDALCLP